MSTARRYRKSFEKWRGNMAFEIKQQVFDDLVRICYEVYNKKEVEPVNVVMDRLMNLEDLPIHCPYHHFIVPAALLTETAIMTDRSIDELDVWLEIAEERAKTVPGGFCGNCGTCGAAVGIGIFVSVYTEASPMTVENWQWANESTGRCLQRIASYPGPRCCKRTCYLALQEGVPYINEKCGLSLQIDPALVCTFSNRNPDCILSQCPFCKEHPRNTPEGYQIICPERKMPKPDPYKDCDCIHRPVELTESRGVIEWKVLDGDFVKKGELIAEGEINKLTIQFFAETDGILIKNIMDGEVFTYGTVLGSIKASI